MQDFIVKSPDDRHYITLRNIGEIRFGPPYFSLSLDDVHFGERIFGDDYLWSPDSQYFAIQEWTTTDYNLGPQTQLLLIDVINHSECVLSRADKGFIVPKAFKASTIIYTKNYQGKGIVKEYDLDIGSLKWRPIEIINRR